MYDVIIIGGGASGLFSAITLKKHNPNCKVIILERSSGLLSKVKVSGGGRCNVTNACYDPISLSKNYPRGEKELVGAFNRFGPKDIIEYFKNRGVELKIESGSRVFPETNKSETIINSLLLDAKTLGVEICINQEIKNILKQKDVFKIELDGKSMFSRRVIIATGNSPIGYKYAEQFGHSIQKPVPSLFAFNISLSYLKKLSGISHKEVELKIKNTNFSQKGSILITHFGFSGPVVLNLSSFAARYLYDKKYKVELVVNWLVNLSPDEILKKLLSIKESGSKRTLYHENLFKFPKSLWFAFLHSFEKRFYKGINDLSKKDFVLLKQKLHADSYFLEGKTTNKKEFVTCGGVTLKEINFKTMESKICSGLFFVGEILDIDGITGGFNFQNAWTTAFIAGNSIF
jgi:predicted Rossmann fold flavoprotein